MSDKMLIEKMASSVEGVPPVPPRAEIVEVRRHSLDEIQQRAKRFLDRTGEVFNLPGKHRDWVVHQDRTLVRMPAGAYARVYHASGAMKLVTGLKPMESLFNKVEERANLAERVKEAADRLNIREWVGQNDSLAFERLWQIKAAAADRKGQVVAPVLCRVVGAYRHFVGEFSVWGAASVVVKLAGEGTLDSLTVQVRATTGKVIDRVEIVRPHQAAHQILLQLSHLMGESKIPIGEIATPRWLRFGYLSLSKRKAQRVLAPVYIATIEIKERPVSQAYVVIVPATEKIYLPLPQGMEASPSPRRGAE